MRLAANRKSPLRSPGRRQPVWLRRGLAPIATSLALGLSACGGDDGGGGKVATIGERAGVEQNGSPGGGSSGGKASGKSPSQAGTGGQARVRKGYRSVKDLDPVSLQKAVKDLNDLFGEKRRELRRGRRLSKAEVDALARESVRVVASAVLRLLGFDKAQVKVGPNGRTVVILFEGKQACTARPSDERAISRKIKQQTRRVVKKVTIRVGSQPLRRYLATKCADGQGFDESGDGGTGKIVYEGTNVGKRRGIVSSPNFPIYAKRWVIEYENLGAAFQVFLEKDEKLFAVPINTQERGVGKKTLDGPGYFRLTIGGSGVWRVRVRDGKTRDGK